METFTCVGSGRHGARVTCGFRKLLRANHRPIHVAHDVHTRRRDGVGILKMRSCEKKHPSRASWHAAPRGKSTAGKIAARKSHMADESGRENDVSCTCELCIAYDYYAKSAREKLEMHEDVLPKGLCLISRIGTFGAQ